jgi:hydrophobe/amphiphile efflux-1 (HAE1) family protein
MNRISSWSIRNPVPTIVLFLALTIAGLFSFFALRINNMPDIDLPTVTVTVTQPGASPTELQTQVTQVVENAVASLGGVDDVSSTVTEGASITTVEFALETDPDRATNDVRNAVANIEGSLPAGAGTPIVTRMDGTGQAVLTFAVESGALSVEELSWFVDDAVGSALLAIGGVSKIERSGGVDRAIRVALDPDRLAALGITVAEVSQALARVNVNEPGGRVVIGGQEQTVRTVGKVGSVAELAGLRIRTGAGDVRLADLGSVEDGWAEQRQLARFDGREVVAFSVYRASASSEVDVADTARAAVKALAVASPDVTMTEVTSSSDFVVESYDAALEALWIGALLAIGIVWLFLRDVRATLVAAAALPLSLIPTFAVLNLLDISLNTITLLALSLVVGLLVDDAIVEIENIVRHMRQTGKRAYDAAIEAADEIGLAVVATTFAIVAVFVPVAFMPGIPGKFFLDFAVAVCVSVLFSLLVARMVTPLMGAYLVKAGKHRGDDQPRWIPAYLAFLRLALRHRWITLAAGILFFVGSMSLATMLPSEFMPATDRGRSLISVTLPAGSTLADTDAVVRAVTDSLSGEPEVESIFASIGATSTAGMGPGGGTSSGSVTSATISVNLVPRGERTASQQDFETRVSPKLEDIPGARLQFGGGGQSGGKASVTLVGNDPDALKAASDALLVQLTGVDGFLNATSTATAARPELLIVPDDAKAAEAGITAAEIANTVSIATLGDSDNSLAKFGLGDRQVTIIVTLTDAARGDPEKIALLPLTGSRATVPLGAVADISYGSGPSTIHRYDRMESATVEVQLAGITLGQAAERIAALPIMQDLPDGVSEVKAGDQARLAELVSGFMMAIAAGILLMYATLVLLFRGFVHPVTILVALPLAVGGALGFLLLTGSALAVSTYIGLLLLMGIAAKNSILLVEYAIVAMRERGLPRGEALLDAAAKRARPILMTSLAMGLGMLPIALGIGADAESRAPMAIAVIGGLLSSTLLSLVYVPVVFTVMDDLQGWLGRILRRLLVRDEPAAGQESNFGGNTQ